MNIEVSFFCLTIALKKPDVVRFCCSEHAYQIKYMVLCVCVVHMQTTHTLAHVFIKNIRFTWPATSVETLRTNGGGRRATLHASQGEGATFFTGNGYLIIIRNCHSSAGIQSIWFARFNGIHFDTGSRRDRQTQHTRQRRCNRLDVDAAMGRHGPNRGWSRQVRGRKPPDTEVRLLFLSYGSQLNSTWNLSMLRGEVR